MLARCVDILSRSTRTKCATPIPSSLFPPFLNTQMPRAQQIAFLLSHLSHPVLIDALCIHIYCACIPFLIFVHITFQRACALRALGLLLADGAPTVHIVYFVKYDVTVSFVAQVLDTVTYFVSQVLVVDTVTYFDIYWQ